MLIIQSPKYIFIQNSNVKYWISIRTYLDNERIQKII